MSRDETDHLSKFRVKQHNFAIPFKPRIVVKPGLRLWRCDACDSEVIFPISYTQSEVNRRMIKKMPCFNAQMFENIS